MPRALDLNGFETDTLKVLSPTHNKDCNKCLLWECSCKLCGKSFLASSRDIRDKRVKSCGCLKSVHAKILIENNKRANTFIQKSGYTEMYDYQNNVCLVDTEDVEYISKHYWSMGSKGYWSSYYDGHTHKLHNYILPHENGEVVDHINHNRSDNRKSQLRVVSNLTNSRNRLKNSNSIDPTLPVGVSRTSNNKFRVCIRSCGVRKDKTVATLAEAIELRAQWEEELWRT